MSKAIFPGSFDPIHNGHIKIIKLAAKSYDHLVVFVANNERKIHTVDLKTRYFVVKKAIENLGFSNVEAVMQRGLEPTAIYAKNNDIEAIVRGNIDKNSHLSDYESKIADEYLDLNPNLTFHYFTFHDVESISSTLVRHYIKTKKDISNMVPSSILIDIKKIWSKEE